MTIRSRRGRSPALPGSPSGIDPQAVPVRRSLDLSVELILNRWAAATLVACLILLAVVLLAPGDSAYDRLRGLLASVLGS